MLLRSEISRQSARQRKPSVNIANGLRAFAKITFHVYARVWGICNFERGGIV